MKKRLVSIVVALFIVLSAFPVLAATPDGKVRVAVAASIQDGGTISGAGDYYLGESVTLTAKPNQGFRFVGYSIDGQFISYNYKISFITKKSYSIKAHFARIGVPLVELGLKVNGSSLEQFLSDFFSDSDLDDDDTIESYTHARDFLGEDDFDPDNPFGDVEYPDGGIDDLQELIDNGALKFDIELGWNDVKGAYCYDIWRSSERFTQYERIGRTRECGFVDKNVENDDVYYYRVRAVCVAGNTITFGSYNTVNLFAGIDLDDGGVDIIEPNEDDEFIDI